MPLNVCNSTIGFGSIKYNFFMNKRKEPDRGLYQFYFSTHRLSKICSMQATVKEGPYILKVSKNVSFGYFSKAIAGENGPKIRHILLHLV